MIKFSVSTQLFHVEDSAISLMIAFAQLNSDDLKRLDLIERFAYTS